MTDASAVDDHRLEIDEDACLALTGSADQCGNGLDTDAADADAGLCGVHADTDAVRVTDFDSRAWAGLLNEFTDLFRDNTTAYALATLSPDIEDVWDTLTCVQELTIGPLEFSVSQVCGLARDLASHPDLDVDDHPLGTGGCIALQGADAKHHSCPNSAYGQSLLCGVHQDADLPGTLLDDDEYGSTYEAVTVDGDDYLLVEQRGEDLIVVDVDEWLIQRLDGAASIASDGARIEEPEPPSRLPKYLREGLQKQNVEDLRVVAEFAEELAAYREQRQQRALEANADRDVDDVPDEWDDDEWEDELEEAREKADLSEPKGTLTTKTIENRDYYYLQWREGDKIRSQYVAPVAPADSS